MYCAVEAHNKKTGNWDCFGISQADRNYAMFSKIADVRNSEKEASYIEPIDDPRGWPADISDVAKTWKQDHDHYHSDTWLDRAELESLEKWLNEKQENSLWEMLGFRHIKYLFNTKNNWRKAAFTRYDNLRVLFFFTD